MLHKKREEDEVVVFWTMFLGLCDDENGDEDGEEGEGRTNNLLSYVYIWQLVIL